MLTATDPAGDEAYFAALRRTEFARLDRRGEAYLDYTGAGLYAASQVRAHAAWLERDTFGNPHAEHGASRRSTAIVERAKRRVLEWFDADGRDYDVCFTANATGAIKLVAESYRFGRGRALVLSADNHNSMNGVREYARRAGAAVRYVRLDPRLRLIDASRELDAAAGEGGLFGFPAQSNFSGVRHPLTLVDAAHDRGFDVLLDASAFAPTACLSLRQTPADFVAVSFYKIFGYPTGVGALVARREALARLTRPWFAGGTVEYASVAAFSHKLRPSLEGFEDGTPSFLSLAALAPGFAFLARVGRERLSRRVEHLTATALSQLEALRHDDGSPMVRVYGPASLDGRGGTIAFSVIDREGRDVPYTDVEAASRAASVAVRGGCFCNPGASEAAFGLGAEQLASCLGSLEAGFSPARLSACTGRPVGAIRLSVGIATSEGDLRRAALVFADCARAPHRARVAIA